MPLTFLTSGSWYDRNEVRLTGSLVSAPIVSTVNGKLVAKFTVCTVIEKYCNYHRCVAYGKLAERVQVLKKGELVKVAGRLKTSGEILAWTIIAHATEGLAVRAVRVPHPGPKTGAITPSYPAPQHPAAMALGQEG
jgi:hypothetical protein